MKRIMEDLKPEAAYISERNRKCGDILVVNVNSPSDVPRLAEPWFLTINTEVEFRIT